nr:immunoglobulin light chain junction region [Macaca mulatta]MOX83204.1 immunoglobulin light chain junction region [Macaca mulatta]
DYYCLIWHNSAWLF